MVSFHRFSIVALTAIGIALAGYAGGPDAAGVARDFTVRITVGDEVSGDSTPTRWSSTAEASPRRSA